MAASRHEWGGPSRQYHDPYYAGPPLDGLPPSYPPPSGYGTPRSGGGPPPSHHPQHSPMLARSGSDVGDYYYDRPLSPGFGSPPPYPPYAPPSPMGSAPPSAYRGPPSSSRSQMIHRGTPPFSSRGAAMSASRSYPPPPPQRYVDARHPGGPPSNFFPESPFSPRARNTPAGPRSRMVMPLHRQGLPPVPPGAGSAPWEPPSPDSELQKKPIRGRDEEEAENLFAATPAEGSDEEESEQGGDPLALLAKVSSDMEKPEKGGNANPKKKKKSSSSVPPTSPLRRPAERKSPVTPTTDNTNKRKEAQIDPDFPEVPPPPRPPPDYAPVGNGVKAAKGVKAVTPMPAYGFPPHPEDARSGPPPPYHYGSSGYPPYPPPRGAPMPPSWEREHEFSQPHPAVVGMHSFDSHDSVGSYEPPPAPRSYYRGPPPPGQGSYGPPPNDWAPRSPLPPRGPPPPGYSQPRYMYGPPPPGRPAEPYPMTPYAYAQQGHMEEKTVLRRKFSWKHYPELERFLIANRDDYLEHSSKNYTAEQKQYNNWLTEQLLAVAEQHSYVFDPEDFNFVAIRDRIRCYYKSYVQTARKRGLELPGKAHIKKQRPSNSLDKYEEEKDKKIREEDDDESHSSATDEEEAKEEDFAKEDSSKPRRTAKQEC